MTRFGENSTLWRNFQSLWPFLRVSFVLGKFSNILWYICNAVGQIFVDLNGQILKNIYPSGHSEEH